MRPATVEDIPALLVIRGAVLENRLSHPSLVPASSYVEFITVSTIWVWEEGGVLCGFSAGDPRNGSVWALFVSPAWERRGIARALLPRVLEDLRRAGWTRATLSTQPMTRAETFYRRQGWTPGASTPTGDLEFSIPLV